MNDEIAGVQACECDVLQQDGIDAWMKAIHIEVDQHIMVAICGRRMAAKAS